MLLGRRHVAMVPLACAILLAFACGATSTNTPSDGGASPLDGAPQDASDGSDARPDERVCKTTESVDEDDWIEAKNERCCGDGLVFTDIAIVSDAGTCIEPAPPSALLCTRCGDGVCKPPENRCNCPKDCPQ